MREHPFEALPDAVEVGGRRVPVETDFRFGVALETELFCEAPDVEGLLRRFYLQGIPSPVEEAVRRMIEFYAHGDRPPGGGQGGDVKRCYDFAQDADALLASFLDAYGIDLSAAKLHWWTFRRLMLNLPADGPDPLPHRRSEKTGAGGAQALQKDARPLRHPHGWGAPAADGGAAGRSSAGEGETAL